MSQKFKTVKPEFNSPNDPHGPSSLASAARPGFRHQNDHNRIFLSDNELEKIKHRIRKKHRTDTAKLLTVYGILLVIFIWYVFTNDVFH